MEKLSSPIALIKRSFEIFFERENLMNLMKIYAWLLPFQAFFLYQNYFVSMQSELLNEPNATAVLSHNPTFFTIVIVVNILFFVASFLVEISAIKSLNLIVTGSSLDLKQVFVSAKSRVLKFFLLSLLLWLIITLGVILLIIPGLIFAVWYAFAKFVFVDKDAGIVESLKRSRTLLKGRFWAVTGRFIVFLLFGVLVQVIFATVPYGIGTLVATLFGALLILPPFLLYKELTA